MDAILEKYSQLSTFELIELRYMATETVGIDITVFITLVFAYITVAYLVGRKLNRFETVSVSILYTLFALFNFFSVVAETRTIIEAQHLLFGTPLNPPVRIGFLTMLVLIWLFSLFFMYRTKRNDVT